MRQLKFALMSDLHLEFGEYKGTLPEADCLLLAGDIYAQYPAGVRNYKKFKEQIEDAGYDQVIMIDGNHTGYGGSILDFNNKNTVTKVGDVVVLSTTLWSGEDSEYAYSRINDKLAIDGFTWKWMRSRHEDSIKFLEYSLNKYHNDKVIVMTHHAPSKKCVHQQWEASDCNLAFYTDLDYLIERYEPNVWVHGHMHNSHDFMLGSTRVICNPHGYPRENTDGFNKSLTFSV